MPYLEQTNKDEYRPVKDRPPFPGDKDPDKIKIINGTPIEQDRCWKSCCETFLAVADLEDVRRHRNSITSRWKAGDTVSFFLEKQDENGDWKNISVTLTTNIMPSDIDVKYTTIEWRDIAIAEGFGCYRLKSNSSIAGQPVEVLIYGVWTLVPYVKDCIYGADGYVRIFSEFNDKSDYFDVDFTGSFLPDCLFVKGFFGDFDPRTVVDNYEKNSGKMEKIRREDFDEYTLTIEPHELPIIYWLRAHVLHENSCWITDQNAYNFEYFIDKPVIVSEGFVPNHPGKTRKVSGTVKFEDKIRKSRSHFGNNRQTSENERPPQVISIPVMPITAPLIKTGVTQQDTIGDDGGTQRGRLADFETLDESSIWGNTDRFIDILGGQDFSGNHNIVIDASTYNSNEKTVLGYYRRLWAPGGVFNYTWDNAVTTAAAASVGPFVSGWYLWNENEKDNIVNKGISSGFGYGPFDNPGGQLIGQAIWTSTPLEISRGGVPTNPATQAIFTQFYGRSQWSNKTSVLRIIITRIFNVDTSAPSPILS